MTWSFHVGMKVVCVDDGGFDADRPGLIKSGRTYTIREIFEAPAHWLLRHGCTTTLRLVGIRRVSDTGLAAIRFRPVEPKHVKLFRSIAQGVTDGKPIIKDPMPLKEVLV